MLLIKTEIQRKSWGLIYVWVAHITGITGQDGSYLAEFLLEKGYEVHGIVRRASIPNTARIDHLIEKNVIKLHDGDLSDSSGADSFGGRDQTG